MLTFFQSILSLRTLMDSDHYSSYDEAVKILYTANTQAKNKTKITKEFGEQQTKLVECYLNRIGLQVTDIDGLNPIHIAGTKGKGSVSALCESILRAKGYKTGLFSSPHLLEVRERIRINGHPISKELFVKCFWDVFNKLKETTMGIQMEETFPRFFSFFCLIAYKVFLQEKVDVAIIEVGIGGSYDSTNIIRHPKVCGITSLGYDHTNILGDSLAEIAWHKSGIFKPGSPAITAPQPSEALEVIRERAKELGSSSLMVSPQYSSYSNHVAASVGIDGGHQFINASLAVQVCKSWLNEMGHQCTTNQVDLLAPHSGGEGKDIINGEVQNKCGIPVAEPFTLPPEFIKGLRDCKWPGRCQVIKREGVTYFLDCAHTNKSIKYCTEWFLKGSTNDADKNKHCNPIKVLLFHFTGERDAAFLMDPLIRLDFQYSAFCPNIVDTIELSSSVDSVIFTTTPEEAVPRAKANALLWKQLHEQQDRCSSEGSCVIPKLTSEPLVFESISKAIQWIQGSVMSSDTHVQVLVCGSTYLVGGVMKYLGYDTDKLIQI